LTTEHERAERACQEALHQMHQGKLVQPRRLLEAALRDDPHHLPVRIALVELALRESDTTRAVREAKRATSIALLRSREAGLQPGEYASHPAGHMLLAALATAGRAHLAAGEAGEAINAFAVVLHEDPEDSYGVCADLIGIFLAQGRPEGVIGLYRLGYAHGMNLLDVALAAHARGASEIAFKALVDALEGVPGALEVLEALVLPRDADQEHSAVEFVLRRKPTWIALPHARYQIRQILEHPVVQRTLDLVAELDADADGDDDDEELAETRARMFENLRSDQVVQSVLASLGDA
jgi:tetratricopeptide (TPR) repeat protein